MRRREFIAGLGGAAVWPIAARAQQPANMRRIAVLMDRTATDTIPQSYLAAFTRGLQQFGWTEHENLRMDVRWTAGDVELARIYAAQLIGLMPDVILASTTTNLTVIRQATTTIPVVFVSVADPVAQGFVTSLKEPAGISLVSVSPTSRLAVNGLNYSRKPHPACCASRSCSTPTRLRRPSF